MGEAEVMRVLFDQLGKVACFRELLSEYIVNTCFSWEGDFLKTVVDFNDVLVFESAQNCPLVEKMSNLPYSCAFHTLQNKLKIFSLNKEDLRVAASANGLYFSFSELH